VPEDAKPNTPEAATAFARWYVEQGSQAAVSWDASVIDAYGDPTCTACSGLASDIRKLQELGYRYAERRYSFIASQVGPTTAQDGYLVDLLGTDRAASLLDSNGTLVR